MYVGSFPKYTEIDRHLTSTATNADQFDLVCLAKFMELSHDVHFNFDLAVNKLITNKTQDVVFCGFENIP